MKTKTKILILFVLMLMFIMIPTKVSAAETLDIKVVGTYNYTKAQEVLDLLNEYRTENGLGTLTMDEELLNAAMIRSGEICIYLSHTRPNGTDCFTASDKMSGENIAGGQRSASSVMGSWKESPGHNSNMLDENFKSVGIGCFDLGGLCYWVQCFSYEEATKETGRTGTSDVNQTVTILDRLTEVYAYTVKNSSYSNRMEPGNDGYIIFGIKNQGWNATYAPGNMSDYNFTSSDPTVIQTNSDGTFYAVGGGQATISLTLKADSSKKFTETITVQGPKISIEKYLFNATYYADRYPDLKAAFGYNESSLRSHWLNFGIKEGRSASPVFDPIYYINKYSDLKSVYRTDYLAAYNHFIQFGINEGRQASKYFDVNFYLSNNQDVKNAYSSSKVLALIHYADYGISEGRRGSNDFNVVSYRNSQNAYTKKQLGTTYIKYYALADGGNPINDSPINITNYLFDSKYYADKYPDLKAAFGYNESSLRSHWLNFGIKEGRSASPVFDPVYYINKYQDLKSAFGTDYLGAYNHFIQFGINEGRQASSTFNVVKYINNYSDLKETFGPNYSKALEHYMQFGRNEGRKAV